MLFSIWFIAKQNEYIPNAIKMIENSRRISNKYIHTHKAIMYKSGEIVSTKQQMRTLLSSQSKVKWLKEYLSFPVITKKTQLSKLFCLFIVDVIFEMRWLFHLPGYERTKIKK